PEGYVYGEPQYFATAMPTRIGALPLVVKSYEGRPVKIEGNSLFPGSNGGTDRYAQASILDLYDPDRARHFKHDGKEVSREEALKFLGELSRKFSGNQGEGLAFLVETSTSPSRARLQKLIAQKFPKSQWFTYDAIDSGIHQRAASQAFGQPVKPVFHFDKAKVILSLDADFIGGEDGVHEHIRKFVAGRKAEQGMSRLYAVESLFTLTGANADHRLRIAASLVGAIASAIHAQVAGQAVSAASGVDAQWVTECAKDLIAAGKNALVVAGQRQPLKVHLLAYAINAALGATGNTVELCGANVIEGAKFEDFDASAPDTLVVLGGNPAYHLNWHAKPKSLVRLGFYEDETAQKADWHFPAAHYLESWGDAQTHDGATVPVQPLIQPLFGGLTELELLAHLAGDTQSSAHDIVRETFGGSEEAWKKFLFYGVQSGSVGKSQTVRFQGTAQPVTATAPSAQSLEVVFFRDSKVDDGRYANNGWMQELPDPVTKVTWDNAVLISRKTASDLGVQNGDIVEITLSGKSVKGPIWVQPGMADYSLGLALGYG
ncbi:MAG TPA: hydrogenase, partial [Verrucomicrobiae bacterium]